MNWKRVLSSSLISVIFALVLLVTVATGQAQAAFAFHSGFETGDFAEGWAVTGSPSVQGTTKNTGDYAMRCNPNNTTAYVETSGHRNAGERWTAYLYISTAPDAECKIFNQVPGDGYVGLTTDRYLKLYDGVSLKDTGTTQLVTSTWHRISFGHGSEGGDDNKVYLNGVEELAHTGFFTTWNDDLRVGVQTSCTADLYFDDIALEGTNSSADLGDIRVLRSVPIAEGTHDDWKDTANGAQTYDDVDEVPADTADYAWFEADDTLQQQTWTTTTMTTLGIDGLTPNAISSWFYYDTDGGGTPDEYFTYMRDNGTDYSTSIDDPKDPTWVNRYDATMPNGGGAWTEARVDAYEIGMATDDKNKDIWCYTAYKMIAYTVGAEAEADISNTPSSENLGTLSENSTYYAYGSAPSNPVQDGECTFSVTNSSGAAVDITIEADNFTGGVGWGLVSTSPGENIVRMTSYYSGQNPASGLVLSNSPQAFISALADNTSKKWDFKIETGTFTDGEGKSTTITLAATLS